MPAPTWCSIPADFGLMAFEKEAVKSVYQDSAMTGYHFMSLDHTEGHAPIIRPPHIGARQRVAQDGLIQGQADPAVRCTMPFRYDDAELQLESVLGGPSTTGAWSIADALSGWSIGINDTVRYWNYGGCTASSLTIDGSFGSPVTGSFEFLAHNRTSEAAGSYPSPSVAPSLRPYIMEDAAIVGDGSATPSTVLKPQGFSINLNNGLLVNRAPGERFPNCITAGAFIVNGTLTLEYTEEHESILRAALEAYSLFYVQFAFTTGAKVVTLKFPCKLVASSLSIPEGNAPMGADVSFECAADDFSFTTPTVAATSTTY